MLYEWTRAIAGRKPGQVEDLDPAARVTGVWLGHGVIKPHAEPDPEPGPTPEADPPPHALDFELRDVQAPTLDKQVKSAPERKDEG